MVLRKRVITTERTTVIDNEKTVNITILSVNEITRYKKIIIFLYLVYIIPIETITFCFKIMESTRHKKTKKKKTAKGEIEHPRRRLLFYCLLFYRKH